ncbi:uncharacterized protein LOC123878153 [Maniola jurtina]|uniref:uncharacterized protein LOC123878153 n=1 Tax=Maniola jurtina TaxID=191418 RepID=UPI001E68F8F5|nr:uncharacterized protein LOC123878153 [Maniola jurtina]
MFKALSLLVLFVLVQGHRGKIQNEADAQSALMPQELNPAFVPDKEAWNTVLATRQRRQAYDDTILSRLKTYSRVVTCIVLAVSAIIEIVVYFVEIYSS